MDRHRQTQRSIERRVHTTDEQAQTITHRNRERSDFTKVNA